MLFTTVLILIFVTMKQELCNFLLKNSRRATNAGHAGSPQLLINADIYVGIIILMLLLMQSTL